MQFRPAKCMKPVVDMHDQRMEWTTRVRSFITSCVIKAKHTQWTNHTTITYYLQGPEAKSRWNGLKYKNGLVFVVYKYVRCVCLNSNAFLIVPFHTISYFELHLDIFAIETIPWVTPTSHLKETFEILYLLRLTSIIKTCI